MSALWAGLLLKEDCAYFVESFEQDVQLEEGKTVSLQEVVLLQVEREDGVLHTAKHKPHVLRVWKQQEVSIEVRTDLAQNVRGLFMELHFLKLFLNLTFLQKYIFI